MVKGQSLIYDIALFTTSVYTALAIGCSSAQTMKEITKNNEGPYDIQIKNNMKKDNKDNLKKEEYIPTPTDKKIDEMEIKWDNRFKGLEGLINKEREDREEAEKVRKLEQINEKRQELCLKVKRKVAGYDGNPDSLSHEDLGRLAKILGYEEIPMQGNENRLNYFELTFKDLKNKESPLMILKIGEKEYNLSTNDASLILNLDYKNLNSEYKK